jgi:hypothetical protein
MRTAVVEPLMQHGQEVNLVHGENSVVTRLL